MQKTKKTALWACVIVLACMLSYCIVSKVQQYNYIHSEYRTGAMSVQKDPSETFEVRELISEKQRNGGVTLYRAAYYPEAETLNRRVISISTISRRKTICRSAKNTALVLRSLRMSLRTRSRKP